MTPKEKARELINKMKLCLFSDGYYDAKKCALIAVDELIKDNLQNENIVNGGLNAEYWQQVKQEIELL